MDGLDSQSDLASQLRACHEKIRRLSMCMEVAQLISSSLNLDEVLDRIMTTSRTVMGADASSLMLVDEKTGELVFQVAQGRVGEQLLAGFRLPRGQGIAGHVCETGEPVLVQDAYIDPRFHRDFDERTGYRTKSILCVPLKIQGKIIGVSQVINKLDGTPFNSEDLDTFTHLCKHAAIAIENARMHRALLRKQQIESDLAFARSVQKSFLPKELPMVKGYSFCAHYQSAMEVGGDFYDFIPLRGKRWGVLIGDVSGKGVSSALYMARLTSDFRLRATQRGSPSKVVADINEELCKSHQRGTFVTLLYLVLDPVKGSVRFVNAGHLPPVLVNAVGGRMRSFWGKGDPPAGILMGRKYGVHRCRLRPGDCLLMLTDGLLEARNRKGESFGWEGVEKVVQSVTPHPAAVVEALLKALEDFTGGVPQADDVTLVALGMEEQ
ncbi:MAG: PP2C family protein-serine/threonine phosphatase [Thermodesulfobacteriota bacterium]